jgi:RNA polymerase sigma-70 factor (ECF subfamily)
MRGRRAPQHRLEESQRVTESIRDRMVEILPRLRRFAYALTRNWDDADDLVQEACARALSRAHLWDPNARLDSWMFRIAQNLWLDKIRSAKVRGQFSDIEDASEHMDCDGRDVTEHRLTLRAVERNLALLPHDQQVVIALVCIEGLAYREAAEVLEVPIGTVMSRLARARSALYESIFGARPRPASGKASGSSRR